MELLVEVESVRALAFTPLQVAGSFSQVKVGHFWRNHKSQLTFSSQRLCTETPHV